MKLRDGNTLAYTEKQGCNPTIIFIHGWLLSKQVWKDIQEALPNHSIAYDIRGHGESSKPPQKDAYTLSELVKDLEELITRNNITNPILVGHSMGGMITQAYAHKHKVKQLILLNTFAQNPVTTKAHELMSRIRELAHSKEDITNWKYISHTTPKIAVNHIHTITTFDSREYLGELEIPVDVIVGEHDAITPIEYADELAELTQGKLHIIRGAGHNTPITHTKELLEILSDIVKNYKYASSNIC